MLSDLEDDPFLAAIMHLSTTKMDFPPSIAEIREQTLNLMHGELEAPSAIDAWERIWARIKGDETIVLSDAEKRAREHVGGIWHLKNSQNSTFDRAQFCRAYDELVRRQRLERQATPAVKQYVDLNKPAFNPPDEKAIKQLKPAEKVVNGKKSKYYSKEETEALCRQVFKNIDDIQAGMGLDVTDPYKR
jgi:hypothetical protein